MSILDYITAFGSIATPILILILSGIGWAVRRSFEREAELEDKLREDRIEIYNQILEPFIMFLMPDAAWSMDKRSKRKDKYTAATEIILSIEYRRLGFKMSLMGSDEVVQSYNNIMQYFYNQPNREDGEGVPEEEITQMLDLLGDFLLAIRKSMGNQGTRLGNWDMLEWWMSDARKLRPDSK